MTTRACGASGVSRSRRVGRALAALSLVLAVRVAVLAGAAEQAASSRPAAFPAVKDQSVLHNAHVVTEKVISGAEPEGDASFAALKAMGVKTIISVDGAQPDVEEARKYGMRYVHLPITYGGVTPEQGKAIAKAIDELPGPIYVHCHHGKHRSAAAVAVACVYNGTLKPEQAESVLQTFGTGENYTGLWKAARDARPVDVTELRAFPVKYQERKAIPPLADAMVLVDQHTDHLKAAQKAGWKAPADHPDLDPPHEALQLEEHLRELGRTEDVKGKPADFRTMLAESEAASRALGEALRAASIDPAKADAAMKRVAASCAGCHKVYRD